MTSFATDSSDKLRVCVAQYAPIWENTRKNWELVESILAELDNTDVLLLPEMFTTGFSMNTAYAEESEQVKIKLRRLAQQHHINIIGSAMVTDHDAFYNRLFASLPDGEVHSYDKICLFSYAGEDQAYHPGSNTLIYAYLGWKIKPLICYDLRFSELSSSHQDHDLLVYTASWPEARIAHWDALLRARAIENQCYTIACNRTGTDGNELSYPGHSSIYDYNGSRLAFAKRNKNSRQAEVQFVSATLELAEQKKFRQRLPFAADRPR